MMLNLIRFLVQGVIIFWLVPALLWFPVFAVAGESAQKLQLRDGDSLVLNGQNIRLWGIDAPVQILLWELSYDIPRTFKIFIALSSLMVVLPCSKLFSVGLLTPARTDSWLKGIWQCAYLAR